MEYEAYLSLVTGTIYYHSEYGEIEGALPDDIDDTDKYLPIPQKRYFGLGKRLALSYARQFLPNQLEQIAALFKRRAAFPQFKQLLEAQGLINHWRVYEGEALTMAIRQWGEGNGIAIEG